MCVRHGGAISPRCHAWTVRTIAAPTNAQVARWKNPSASVLVSSPASVVIGCPCGGREHVVPLQDLMEDDAVEEATEPQTQQEAGSARRALATGGHRACLCGHASALPRSRERATCTAAHGSCVYMQRRDAERRERAGCRHGGRGRGRPGSRCRASSRRGHGHRHARVRGHRLGLRRPRHRRGVAARRPVDAHGPARRARRPRPADRAAAAALPPAVHAGRLDPHGDQRPADGDLVPLRAHRVGGKGGARHGDRPPEHLAVLHHPGRALRLRQARDQGHAARHGDRLRRHHPHRVRAARRVRQRRREARRHGAGDLRGDRLVHRARSSSPTSSTGIRRPTSSV